MATLTNGAGALVTVPDTEVNFYKASGWFIPGDAPVEVEPPRAKSRRGKVTAKTPKPVEEPSEEPDGNEP